MVNEWFVVCIRWHGLRAVSSVVFSSPHKEMANEYLACLPEKFPPGTDYAVVNRGRLAELMLEMKGSAAVN